MLDQVFDSSRALSNMGGDQTLLRSMIALFARDAVLTCDRIMQAMQSGDLQELCHLAHSVKGGALAIGAFDCSQAAARLENALRLQDSADIKGLTADALMELDRVRLAVDKGLPWGDEE